MFVFVSMGGGGGMSVYVSIGGWMCGVCICVHRWVDVWGG